jgi:hypothetical protein
MMSMTEARPRVYVETTVVSYLTAQPSRDIVVAAHQQVTREWWQQRGRYELFVSEAVLQEAARGDAVAAAARLAALQGLPVLDVGAAVGDLTRRLLAAGAVPQKALVDAVHIAVAAVNGMDYLLTWNCAHIANATVRVKVEAQCRLAGNAPPVICTPEELTEE